MAYLDYYRSNPAWSTNQWQSIAPPAPSFQPQPSWGGSDFYRAQAGQSYDGGMYNYAMNRLQGMGQQGLAAMGPSLLESKMLHRRAYGGLGDILTMMPTEIGAAAAYEVWRNWRYNYGTLAQPLGGDSMRQREALVGLAIGEATKLWQYTTRAGDSTGQRAAVESAAMVAANIFDQGNDALMRGGGAYGQGNGAGIGGGMGMGAISPMISSASIGGGGMGGMGGGMGTGMSSGMGGMGAGSMGAGGMGAGGMGAGGMGAGGMGGGGMGMGGGGMGMGAGGMGAGGMEAGGMGMGAGMGGGIPGRISPSPYASQGMGMGASGMGSSGGFAAPQVMRQRSHSFSALPGSYGGNPGGYAGSDSGMGMGQAMYGGVDGMLGAGGMGAGGGGMGIQRPLSSSGVPFGSASEYGPGGLGETSIARHERHRAERAAMKEARYAQGGSSGSGRAYDDNYAYEYGRGGQGGYGGGQGSNYGDGYGSDYGGGGSGGSGGGYGAGYGGGAYGMESERPRRHGHRLHRAEREAERYALEAAGGGGSYGRYPGGY